jgi:fumarate hydratase subunit alpha
MDGRKMAITEAIISDVCEHLYEKALKRMPGDIIASLQESCDRETNPVAKWNLQAILQNIQAAEERDLLVCQDTCIPSYVVKMGTRIHVQGDIYKAIAQGAQRATLQIPLIPHAVHPLTRVNPGTNVGEKVPLLHFEILPEADFLEIMAVPMAGGGEIYSKLKMFDYTATLDPIKKFVSDTVIATGGNDCAPLIVGIGIGGSFDTVGKLARDAAIRNLSERNGDPAVEKIEGELLAAINKIGFGPMGLGGDTTALAVNIETGFSHRVITPVAVKIHCWAVRRAAARIDGNGKVTHL